MLDRVPNAEVDEADTTITAEYYRPGSENPGEVVGKNMVLEQPKFDPGTI